MPSNPDLRPPPPPARGARPTRKTHSILGLVRDLEAPGRPGEDDVVIADYRAAAQYGKTDVSDATRAGVPSRARTNRCP